MKLLSTSYVLGKQRNIETWINDDEFQALLTFFALLVYNLSKRFKACLESVWSLYQLKPPFMKLRSCQCRAVHKL